MSEELGSYGLLPSSGAGAGQFDGSGFGKNFYSDDRIKQLIRQEIKTNNETIFRKAVEKIAEEQRGTSPSQSETGYMVWHQTTLGVEATWHAGADQYVVTEHAHLRIKKDRLNLAEYASWQRVRWQESPES